MDAAGAGALAADEAAHEERAPADGRSPPARDGRPTPAPSTAPSVRRRSGRIGPFSSRGLPRHAAPRRVSWARATASLPALGLVGAGLGGGRPLSRGAVPPSSAARAVLSMHPPGRRHAPPRPRHTRAARGGM